MIVFWYYDWWQRIARINVWYWNIGQVNNHYLSNIDYNIDSIYYWTTTQKLASLIKVKISN